MGWHMPNGSYGGVRVSMGVPPPSDGRGIYVLVCALLCLFVLDCACLGVSDPLRRKEYVLDYACLCLFVLDCACLCLFVFRRFLSVFCLSFCAFSYLFVLL